MSLNFFGLTFGIILIIIQGGQSLETETSEDRRAKCMFRSSHFWFLVTFGDEVMKIRKYYVIFVYILKGKMGKTEKKWKENHTTKVTKIAKTKRRKYGMNETFVIFSLFFFKSLVIVFVIF